MEMDSWYMKKKMYTMKMISRLEDSKDEYIMKEEFEKEGPRVR